MSSRLEQLESLLLDWECGSLDDRGVERLRELLKGSADARSYFVHMQMIGAAMQIESDAGVTPPPGDSSGPTPASAGRKKQPTRRFPENSFWLISALSLLVCVLAGWISFLQFADRPPSLLKSGVARDTSEEATAQGVALVTRLIDVAWGTDQPVIEVGEALTPGRFAIRSGHAQIEFFCGATVVVEGPAELELESATRAKVRSGRLRTHVPPAARGFSLEVEDLKVVDLGTEFGLAVSPDGATVQVFDGEVELRGGSDKKRRLTTGQAIVRTARGEFRETVISPQDFVGIAGLETRAQLQRTARYERWRRWSETLRRDPRSIAYYTFDQQGDWQRRLTCSKEPADSELDGAIVGAREVRGRWGEKRALEFKRPADRVRIQIPGDYQSLTFACWVKIDSLDRRYNSLFLTDGYDKGEPHWQILESGQLYFSVRPVQKVRDGPRDFKALSPKFWTPSMSGKWIHLAVTFDIDASSITHYVNGRVLSRHVAPKSQLPASTRIGTASIGNWAIPTIPDAEFAIRNLNGSIDELAILSAALTAKEVLEFYQLGKP